MTPETAFIALGSNQGDRRGNIDRGMEALGALPGTTLIHLSSCHWTPPWGLRDQPWFLNAAASISTGLSPRALMEALLTIEADAGRVRTVPNGPRTLDLDILLYADRVVDEEGLTIPHPRMAERLFVLAPLAEIAGDVIHPVLGLEVGELLARLRESEAVAAQEGGGP